MLTTIVVVILFVVAFCMVVYEWAITLLWGLVAATIVTWIVTVYIEHVKKDLKMYERAYNLFILLRLLTIVLVVALAGIWFLSRLFFWKKTMRGSVKALFHRVLWNYCKSAFFICIMYWLLPHFVIKYYSVIEYGIC